MLGRGVPWRSGKRVGSSRAGITGGYELSNMDVGELRSFARASIALNSLSFSPALNLGDYQIENSSKGGLGNKRSPYGAARNLRIIKRK